MRRLVLFVVLVLLATLVPATATAQDGWSLAAVHPDASQQSTEWGRTVRTLEVWDGQIWPGYGDHGANTGPVRIRPFDPGAERFGPAVHTADTEEINLYRALDGRLFAPSVDTRSGADYAVATSSGSWSNRNAVTSLHVFDMARHDGALWMAGSSGRNATLWRSTDGGSSWSVALSVPPRETSYARFYFAGTLDGRLHVQARDLAGAGHPTSFVHDGSSWGQGPNLIGRGLGQSPRQFRSRLVFQQYYPGFCFGLRSYDGTTVRSHIAAVDFTVVGGYLYALDCNGRVQRTTDLSSWTVLTPGLPGARSIAVIGDTYYVGTKDAAIHRFGAVPAPPEDPPATSPSPSPSPTVSPSPSPSPSPTASPGPTPSPSPSPAPDPPTRRCLLFICF